MSTTTTTPTLGADAAAQAAAAATTQTGATTSTSGSGSGGKTTGADGFGMDKDAFLQILVEQLRHQDPSQPGDSQQYITQMTQFSILEQLTNISEATQVGRVDAAANSAINLVGRTVTYLAEGADGEPEERTGTVEGVDFSEGSPSLTIDGEQGIQLGAIVEVR